MDDYLDSVRFLFDSGSVRCGRSLGEKMVNWNKNCEKLYDYLNCRIGGIKEVSHCTITDVYFFQVEFWDNNVHSEMQISKALNIGRDNCRMVGYNCNGNQINFVIADAVFEKWGNPLCFNKNWLFNHLDDGRLPSVIRDRLNEKCFKNHGVFRDFTFDTIYIKSPCVNRATENRLRHILGIDSWCIGRLYDDEEEEWDGSGWFYINLEKVKEDAR